MMCRRRTFRDATRPRPERGTSGAILKVERLASIEEKRLADAQGSNFGGSWIERKADGNYQLVVATTANSAGRGLSDVEFAACATAQAELETSKAALDDVLAGGRAPEGVYGWHVDLPSNSVVVSIGRGQEHAAIDFVAASGADSATVRFVVDEEQPSLRSTLKGGLGYLRNPGDGYLYACSIGFNVTKGSTPAMSAPVTAARRASRSISRARPVPARSGRSVPGSARSPRPSSRSRDRPATTIPTLPWRPATPCRRRVRMGQRRRHGSRRHRRRRRHGDLPFRPDLRLEMRHDRSDRRHRQLQQRRDDLESHPHHRLLRRRRLRRLVHHRPRPGAGRAFGRQCSCKGKLPNNRTRSFFQPLGPILSAYSLSLTTSP
jgi:streptogrisin C